MKTLKVWNGGHYNGKIHYFVAAYSQKQAAELVTKAGYPTTINELRTYFSACWATDMKDIVPELGVWTTSRISKVTTKPIKVV